MAFHPNFQANGRFFVSYTCLAGSPECAADGTLTVFEFYFDPMNVMNPQQLNVVSFRKVIDFVAAEREANNHNGGQV